MEVSYAGLSATLEDQLKLQLQPVALAFVEEPPADIPRIDTVAPSGCAFWRKAEEEVFYAASEDHFNCPLGAMVMGFVLPEQKMEELQQEVAMMCSISYVREVEVEHIPKMAQSSAGIVYGPLWRFPLEPDAVLLWLTPQQSMMMSECCGLVNWAAGPAGFFGRPGCAVLPMALAQGRPAQSLGCVGMRTNTGVSADLLLAAIPGSMLGTLEADLSRVGEVHREMEAHYLERMARLDAGERSQGS